MYIAIFPFGYCARSFRGLHYRDSPSSGRSSLSSVRLIFSVRAHVCVSTVCVCVVYFRCRFCTAIVHFTVKSVMWESRSHITLIFAIATRLTGAMVNSTEARQQIASQATQFNDRSIRVIYMREYFHNRWFPF